MGVVFRAEHTEGSLFPPRRGLGITAGDLMLLLEFDASARENAAGVAAGSRTLLAGNCGYSIVERNVDFVVFFDGASGFALTSASGYSANVSLRL